MKEKIVYNPSKRYTWKPEDEFVLKGEEFGRILNFLRNTLNTPEAEKILLAQQANNVIENIIAKSVESGIVKEVIDDEPKTEVLKLVKDENA